MYEILEHTADIGIRATGTSMKDLFESAAQGMTSIAFDPTGVREIEQRSVAATAGDRESLLVEFLQEVLWLIDGEAWLPRRVQIDSIAETSIAATAHGEPRDAARHQMRIIIKAVTYHQLSVRETPAGWQAEVYFDI